MERAKQISYYTGRHIHSNKYTYIFLVGIYLFPYLLKVSSCEVCQRNSAKLAVTTTELHPIPVHTTWHHIAIDFIGPISPISLAGNR